MSVQLLDKTRKINKLLHNNNTSKVVFNDICAVLTEILDSLLRELHPAGTFVAKGLGHNANGQNAEISRDLRNNRRSARSGAAAHSGGNKNQTRAL